MKLFKHSCIILLAFFLFKLDVNATICNYNVSGYKDDPTNWTLDTSNGKAEPKNALAPTLNDSGLADYGETVLNWDDSDFSYNIKGKSSCPKYLIQSMGSYGLISPTNRIVAADETNFESILNNKWVQSEGNREVHVMQLANRTKDSTKGSTCKYKGDYTNSLLWFWSYDTPVDATLEYNINGELISIDSSLYSVNMGYVLPSYSLYQEKIVADTCNATIAICQNSLNRNTEHHTYPTYTLYISGVYKQKESKYESSGDGCVSFYLSDGSTDSSGDRVTTSENCGIYETYWADLEKNARGYKQCKDSGSGNCQSYIVDYNENKKKIQTFCGAAYQSMTYADSCVRKCVKELDQNLSNLEFETEIKGKDTSNAKCGLSSRLVAWIMKFINWMRYIIPVLLIILSVLDYIKAIAADSEDEVKKVTSKFVKRLIVAVCIFLVPLALQFLLGIFGINANNFCL